MDIWMDRPPNSQMDLWAAVCEESTASRVASPALGSVCPAAACQKSQQPWAVDTSSEESWRWASFLGRLSIHQAPPPRTSTSGAVCTPVPAQAGHSLYPRVPVCSGQIAGLLSREASLRQAAATHHSCRVSSCQPLGFQKGAEGCLYPLGPLKHPGLEYGLTHSRIRLSLGTALSLVPHIHHF